MINQYIDKQGAAYSEPEGISFASIPVLEFLWGELLTEVSFNWLQALRPSRIRIIRSGCGETTDARPWRVTIYLGRDNMHIAGITQEVDVGCDAGVQHGYDLICKTVPEGFREPEWLVGGDRPPVDKGK